MTRVCNTIVGSFLFFGATTGDGAIDYEEFCSWLHGAQMKTKRGGFDETAFDTDSDGLSPSQRGAGGRPSGSAQSFRGFVINAFPGDGDSTEDDSDDDVTDDEAPPEITADRFPRTTTREFNEVRVALKQALTTGEVDLLAGTGTGNAGEETDESVQRAAQMAAQYMLQDALVPHLSQESQDRLTQGQIIVPEQLLLVEVEARAVSCTRMML